MRKTIIIAMMAVTLVGTSLPMTTVIRADEEQTIDNPWNYRFENETTENFDGTLVDNPWNYMFANETTKESSTTTKKDAKVDKTKVGTVKIVKKISKKKNAKKIKITIAKMQSVNGYEVCVFKSSSAAKKNKKILYKKLIKKNTTTFNVSNKNLKKSKKLYVKVRAYRLVKGNAIYGGWSDIVKVKIKK